MTRFNGFRGDYRGLTTEEVRKLHEKYGKNELVPEKKVTIFTKVFGIFKEPMFLLLFCTANLYFILGEPRDGIIMLIFVSFISGINLFQEWRTDKTLQALKDLSSPRVKVIRNDNIENIESKELAVGDLMIIGEGEKISADGQIIEMYDLGVDESTLTGESEVVWKSLSLSEEDEKAHWRKNFCYAGTMVTQGSAVVKVTGVGQKTEYGKIGQDVVSVPERPTPLEKQTRHLVKVSAAIGLLMFVLVFFVTFQHSGNAIDSFLSGITLAMAMIPEEFPVVLTVFLAMGAWRLANKNSLIRHMPSVETLGAVSVLCVDKTGTLTMNRMTVHEIFTYKEYTKEKLMYWAGLACEIEPYDPMEKAILTYAEDNGINRRNLFEKELIYEYPFSSETRMMGHIWKINEKATLAAKGSPESILPLCRLSAEERREVENVQMKLASKGYRVIAVANHKQMDTVPDDIKENVMELAGLIGFADPPRDKVPEAIKVCIKAGIRVVMITGDSGITAKSTAKKIGIQNSENVITGQELEMMSEEELKERIKITNVFARVIPRHKMRIVKAFKDAGEIVAMTGDGVNDAPALKYADIGIAMGKRGTGVAKEASDMILLDDNFSTIVDTVRDGRRIYDNIKKAIGYIFVIHIPIALTALLTPLLHLPLLLMPIHVVLLELIIDPTCSIIFERQPEEKDIMYRKPRSPREPLITVDLLAKSVLQGLVVFAASFGSYVFMLKNGYPNNTARTFAISVLVFANLFIVYVNQSDRTLAITGILNFLKDKVMLYVNGGMLIVLALIIYVPAANGIVKTAPVSIKQLILALVIAGISTLWWEVIKIIKGREH